MGIIIIIIIIIIITAGSYYVVLWTYFSLFSNSFKPAVKKRSWNAWNA